MTSTLTKTNVLPVVLSDVDLTEHQHQLLTNAWQNFKRSNNHRLQCAFALWELKNDLDANDPNAGQGGGDGTGQGQRTKFWQLFEDGALPFAGNSGKSSVKTALQAAEWVTDAKAKGLAFAFDRLAPATIVEIKALGEPTRQIVYDNLASSDFIGVAAVRLLKQVSDKGAIKELKQWVTTHEGKALTPAAIRPITDAVEAKRAERERQNRIAAERARLEASIPAGSATVNVSTIGRTPEELETKRRHDEVQAIYDAMDAEEQAKFQRDYNSYAEAFTKADAALRRYRSELHNLIMLNGTDYLDQLRDYKSPLTGFNAVENDVEIVSQQWLTELQAICELLTTRRESAKVNFEDPDLVDVDPVL